jgi:hypothetical protein
MVKTVVVLAASQTRNCQVVGNWRSGKKKPIVRKASVATSGTPSEGVGCYTRRGRELQHKHESLGKGNISGNVPLLTIHR